MDHLLFPPCSMSGVTVFILVTPANRMQAVASIEGASEEDGPDTPSLSSTKRKVSAKHL